MSGFPEAGQNFRYINKSSSNCAQPNQNPDTLYSASKDLHPRKHKQGPFTLIQVETAAGPAEADLLESRSSHFLLVSGEICPLIRTQSSSWASPLDIVWRRSKTGIQQEAWSRFKKHHTRRRGVLHTPFYSPALLIHLQLRVETHTTGCCSGLKKIIKSSIQHVFFSPFLSTCVFASVCWFVSPGLSLAFQRWTSVDPKVCGGCLCSLPCPTSESQPSAGAERLDGERTAGRQWGMDVICFSQRATLKTHWKAAHTETGTDSARRGAFSFSYIFPFGFSQFQTLLPFMSSGGFIKFT